MKIFLALLMTVLGLSIGGYVGGYILFVGGLVDLIANIKIVWVSNGEAIPALDLLISIIKIVLANFIGWLCALVFIIPAHQLAKSK